MKQNHPDNSATVAQQPGKVRFVEVDAELAGQRVDNFLINLLKGVPKSLVYRVVRKGEVRVNKGRIKPEYKLAAGDIVRVPPVRIADQREKATPSAQLIEVLQNAILFENDELLVVNKPAGIAVHGGSGVSLGVIEALRHARSAPRLELVHRIDRETSGCLLIAKKRSVLKALQDQFRERDVAKRYTLLVHGKWPRATKVVDVPLKKNQVEGGERIVKVSGEGKPATTEFRVIERFDQATLLEANLLTGRTHQIRVHTQFVGCPLIGDEKYAANDANKAMRAQGLKRMFLHASFLQFRLPSSGEIIALEAPLPDDYKMAIDTLRKG